MGNKPSSNDRKRLHAPPSQPNEHDDTVSCGGLTTKDAWDIALTWRHIIQGCVRLEVDAHKAKFHVVPTFEWVTFVFDGSLSGGLKDVVDIDQAVAAARASTIVWYALSRCAGFDTNENPTFWRRLFSELYFPVYPKDEIVQLKPRPDRPQLPITDAVRFFDDPANPFPRICLVPKQGAEETCLRGFFSSLDHDDKLANALETLRTYMIPSRLAQRVLPVSIDGVAVEKLAPIFRAADVALEKSDTALNLDWQLQTIYIHGNELQQTGAIESILSCTLVNIVLRKCESWNLLPTPRQSATSLVSAFNCRELQVLRTRVQVLDMSESGGVVFPGDRLEKESRDNPHE